MRSDLIQCCPVQWLITLVIEAFASVRLGEPASTSLFQALNAALVLLGHCGGWSDVWDLTTVVRFQLSRMV